MLKRTALFQAVIVASLLSGACAGIRPVISYEASATQNGVVVWQTTPVTRGEIYFRGLPGGAAAVADLFVDGTYVGSAMSSATLYEVNLAKAGWHIVEAKIYWMELGQRKGLYACDRQQFEVTPVSRSYNATVGHWWRVEVGANSRCG